jgi:hypothetical protein
MEDYYDINDFMGSIDKDRRILEEIIFDKIKKSIEEKTSKVCLFNIVSQEEDVTSFYLDREEYGHFLSSYLKACENREEYETCLKIIEIKKILEEK